MTRVFAIAFSLLALTSCATGSKVTPLASSSIQSTSSEPTPQEVWQSPCVRAYRLKQGLVQWVPDEGRVMEVPFPMSCGAFAALVHDEATNPMADIPSAFGFSWICDRVEVPVEELDRNLSLRLLKFRGFETKEEHGRVLVEFGPDHCVGY